MDYKSIALQYHLHYSNLKQRLDLAQRSLDTVDYRIQLELHHQKGLKSIMEKYEDPKYDQAFQYLLTDASNQQQIQEALISDIAHARAEFSDKLIKQQARLTQIQNDKENLITKVRNAYQKQQQSLSFYLSINKVYERNVATLDFINETLEQRIGHIKVIQDLQKNKENTQINYKIATDRYNTVLLDSIPEFEQILSEIKLLELQTSDALRQIYQCMVLAQISAMRNRQYDLDQISKYLEKVDYTKIKTIFKYNDDIFTLIQPDQQLSYLSRMTNAIVINYSIHPVEQISPLKQNEQDEELKNEIKLLCEQINEKGTEGEISKRMDLIEQKMNRNTVIQVVEEMSQYLKAPTFICKSVYHQISSFFCKILDILPKEGVIVQRIQKLSILLHTRNSNQETMTVFQIVSQHGVFSKRNEYWEWLLFWQISQTMEGIQGHDKYLIILQQFQIIVQQMAQLHIQIQIIHSFINDLGVYFNITKADIENIKRMLTKFIQAQNCEPNSTGEIKSFDCVE